jgi:hypothetical protein
MALHNALLLLSLVLLIHPSPRLSRLLVSFTSTSHRPPSRLSSFPSIPGARGVAAIVLTFLCLCFSALHPRIFELTCPLQKPGNPRTSHSSSPMSSSRSRSGSPLRCRLLWCVSCCFPLSSPIPPLRPPIANLSCWSQVMAYDLEPAISSSPSRTTSPAFSRAKRTS